MAQYGHVHHHQGFQYGGRKTSNCKFSHKMKIKVISSLTHKLSTNFKHYIDFGSGFPLEPMGILCDLTASGKSKVAASKLQMHVFPLADNISTKFQRLNLCYWGLTFRLDPWEYDATKPEVEKSKMAASKLQIHVFPLPDKISLSSISTFPHEFLITDDFNIHVDDLTEANAIQLSYSWSCHNTC